MTLSEYKPTFTGVLFKEVREEKTKGGIFIPDKNFVLTTHADVFENQKEHSATGKIGDYVVLKVGKDCSTVQPGDIIFLMRGVIPEQIDLEEGSYPQVVERQIIGYGGKQT